MWVDAKGTISDEDDPRKKGHATTMETWHKRLGHASKGKLTKMHFLKTSTFDLGNFYDSFARAI